MLRFFKLIIITLIFTACTDENNETPDFSGVPEAGTLGVSFFNEFVHGTDTIDILLDTVKSSVSKSFQLKNLGQSDVKDIKIVLYDSNSYVLPIFIYNLPGIVSVPNVEQKLNYAILHGVMSANASIKTPIFMPMGWNHINMSISGKTAKAPNSIDSVYTNLYLSLNFFVQFADYEIFQDDSLINLKESKETIAEGPNKVRQVYAFRYKDAQIYKIKNTGNVKLDYSVFAGDKTFWLLESKSILPFEEGKLMLPLKNDSSKVFISVNSNNVTQNIGKKLAFINGVSYIFLKNTNIK